MSLAVSKIRTARRSFGENMAIIAVMAKPIEASSQGLIDTACPAPMTIRATKAGIR